MATKIGLIPKLNRLLNEIFKPIAAIEIVKIILDITFKAETTFEGKIENETNTDRIMKPKINFGNKNLLSDLPPLPFEANKLNNKINGPSIKILIILIIVAISPVCWLIENPAAVTCPNAWIVEPIIKPNCSSEKSGKKFKSSNGIRKILNAPKVFIVAIDIPMSSFFDPKTLEELAIADEPQIPFPIPIKTDKSFETPKHLPIK